MLAVVGRQLAAGPRRALELRRLLGRLLLLLPGRRRERQRGSRRDLVPWRRALGVDHLVALLQELLLSSGVVDAFDFLHCTIILLGENMFSGFIESRTCSRFSMADFGEQQVLPLSHLKTSVIAAFPLWKKKKIKTMTNREFEVCEN